MEIRGDAKTLGSAGGVGGKAGSVVDVAMAAGPNGIVTPQNN
jgi:hypothetical protein